MFTNLSEKELARLRPGEQVGTFVVDAYIEVLTTALTYPPSVAVLRSDFFENIQGHPERLARPHVRRDMAESFRPALSSDIFGDN